MKRGYSFPIDAFLFVTVYAIAARFVKRVFRFFTFVYTHQKNPALVKIADLGNNKMFIDFTR